MWISLTKYPMKPMTTNPIAIARQSWMYSARSVIGTGHLRVSGCMTGEYGDILRSGSIHTFLVGLSTPVDELNSQPYSSCRITLKRDLTSGRRKRPPLQETTLPSRAVEMTPHRGPCRWSDLLNPNMRLHLRSSLALLRPALSILISRFRSSSRRVAPESSRIIHRLQDSPFATC
jgi:hypothetical protein